MSKLQAGVGKLQAGPPNCVTPLCENLKGEESNSIVEEMNSIVIVIVIDATPE